MKLHLTSAYQTHTALDSLLKQVPLDKIGQHEPCRNAHDSDAILFVENTQFDDLLFKALSRHPLVRQYPQKVFMYNEMDRPWDVMPGLYCCLPRRHSDSRRHCASSYLYSPNPYVNIDNKPSADPRWLYSFMGSMSHACRHRIMRLKHPDSLLKDTSDFNVWNSGDAELKARGEVYARTIEDSQLVLCPRGIGTSSIRLYETLEAGRVPVIISDHWVPPTQTNWDFAIQIEERRISSIPGLLNSLAGEAQERGSAARNAWLASYAPDTVFNTVANSVHDLLSQQQGARSTSVSLHKWLSSGELLTRTAAHKLRGH